jgi:hypothetical protein
MPHKQAGADKMSTTLVVIIVGGLLAADLFIASRWKRYRIRQTATMVMAKVSEVRSWQDMLSRADSSLQKTMHPFVNGRWRYEMSAQWTDPNTGKSSVFTSGIKNGLPPYQRGDYLPAYFSPRGAYLELSPIFAHMSDKLFRWLERTVLWNQTVHE